MDLNQLAQSFDPFMDRSKEAYIQVAVDGEEEVEQLDLKSPLAQSLIRAALAKLVKNGIPTDHQTRAASDVVWALAYGRARGIAKHNVEHQISRKPLAQAVLVIARKGGTKKSLSALLAMLVRAAEREGIDMKKGPWPSNEDALGKQLSPLIPILAEKGVELVRHANERPRTWSISALCEGSGESDGDVTALSTLETSHSADNDTSRPETNLADEEGSPGSSFSDEALSEHLKGIIL